MEYDKAYIEQGPEKMAPIKERFTEIFPAKMRTIASQNVQVLLASTPDFPLATPGMYQCFFACGFPLNKRSITSLMFLEVKLLKAWTISFNRHCFNSARDIVVGHGQDRSLTGTL
jgi:hypothetical protein